MEELATYITNNQLITVIVASFVSVALFVLFIGDED
jgi:hypothetical protein